MSIQDKINLYQNTYVKGEVRSNEYEARVKQEKRLNMKLDLADTMFNDLPFTFTSSQQEHVKQLIIEFKNFAKLYPGLSYEETILSFIFYVRALKNKEMKIKTSLVKKYVDPKRQANYPKTCEIISWKITLHYLRKQPILPVEPKNIDHNILYKG